MSFTPAIKTRAIGICYLPRLLGFMMSAALVLNSSVTKATDRYWNAASGDWSDTNPCPWSLGTEPTSSDNAYIQNGGTATITQEGENCSYLYLGGSKAGTVDMTDGDLSVVNSLIVGNSGVGTYNLSGTGQVAALGENIGYLSNGTFIQSGGTNTVSGTLSLGNSACGTYDLSGMGQLSTDKEYIGLGGVGIFTQSGGINSASYVSIGAGS